MCLGLVWPWLCHVVHVCGVSCVCVHGVGYDVLCSVVLCCVVLC